MGQNIYDQTIPQFTKMLKNLDHILGKAAAYAETKKFDVNNFTTSRLAPDMLPFTKQIQIASDSAKALVQLAGREVPVFEDNEKTWPELQTRVRKTIALLESLKPEEFKNALEVKVSPKWAGGKWLHSQEYVNEVAIPNLYFHIATAYALLRSAGVDLGKADYLGAVNYKN